MSMETVINGTRTAQLWEAVKARLSGKQDKLAGRTGQAVGFDASGAAAAVDGWSGANLLDNWYLADPVNQRGQTDYAAFGYTIDRWISSSAELRLSLTGQGLRVSNPQQAYAFLIQKLEKARFPNREDQTVTLSVLADGTLFSVSGPLRFAELNNSAELSGLPFGGLRIWSTAEHFEFTIDLKEDADVLLQAVKLELGGRQTLARQEEDGTWVLSDPPPNRALELMKCQRYYQVCSGDVVRPSRGMDFRPPMRTDPAWSVLTAGGVSCHAADANL